VDLPFVRTLNLNVEQSHVELWLPVTRHWFGFAGTMRRVHQGGEFEAGYLAYQNKLAKRLMETLQYGSVFEKARAAGNLRQINVKLMESQQAFDESVLLNTDLQVQVAQSQKLVQDADQTLRQAETEQAAVTLEDNRSRMNQAYGSQTTGLARNRVIQAGVNWQESEVRKSDVVAAVSNFDAEWLARNDLKEAAKPDGKPAGPAAGRDEGQVLSKVVAGTTILGRAVAPAQPSEVPQAVQMAIEVDKGQQPQVPAKTAAARRGMQSRAAQYQQKLESKGKGDMVLGGSVPVMPGLVRGIGGMPGGSGRALGEPAGGGRVLDGMGTPGMPGAPAALGGALWGYAGPAGAGLASLDVGFPAFDPQRWRAQRFTTPRGTVEIRARALSERLLEAAERLAVALVAAGVVLGLSRLRRPQSVSVGTQRSLANYLMLAGLLCLLAGVFPLYGVLALLAGAVWRAVLAVVSRSRPC